MLQLHLSDRQFYYHQGATYIRDLTVLSIESPNKGIIKEFCIALYMMTRVSRRRCSHTIVNHKGPDREFCLRKYPLWIYILTNYWFGNSAECIHINPLWRNGAIWRHRSGPILAQVLAYMAAPSQNKNQSWLSSVKYYGFHLRFHRCCKITRGRVYGKITHLKSQPHFHGDKEFKFR